MNEPKEESIVIITGCRGWSDEETIRLVLWGEMMDATGTFVVFHGGCPTGADAIAAKWCKATEDTECIAVEADWQAHGKAAGPIRNRRMIMLAMERAALHPESELRVFAFWDGRSRGTWNCLTEAVKAGVCVNIQPENSYRDGETK